MNKYLLLRDNKQSGPYTVPEIISKGIKPYDLVWLEGKSAAWRYPSEVEELKAYAPVVEEQPFDRFYRKPAEVAVSSEQRQPAAVGASSSVTFSSRPSADHTPYLPKETSPADAEPQPAKKIYINFPGSRSEMTSLPSEDRPIRQAQKPAAVTPAPTVNERAMAERLTPAAAEITPGAPFAESSFSAAPAAYLPGGQRKPAFTQQVFRWTIAACLLLGGILIGISISYNKQRANISQMNAIIQQIQEREKLQSRQRAAASEIIRQAVNDLPAETIPVTSAPTPDASQSASVVRKTPSVKSSVKTAAVPPPTADQASAPVAVAVTPAASSVKEEKPAPVVKELNRENLFKLLSLKSSKYKTGVLGGISNLQLELTNNSLVNLQQVEVEVKYLGPEKKIVRSQTVYFQDIEPGEQLTVDVPKSSRGVSVEYMISKIN